MAALLSQFLSIGSLLGGAAGRLAMIGLLSGTLVATVVTGVTGAIFTDTQLTEANAFSTGTVDINASPASAVVTLSAMAPGDQVVNGLTVSNAGSLQLRYAVTSATTENTLAAQLDLTIWDEAQEGDEGTACNTAAPATVLYGPGDLGSTTGVNVIGVPTQGAQTGDRTLAASRSEVLCIKVALPLSTGNSAQGLSSTATLQFQSEQVANN